MLKIFVYGSFVTGRRYNQYYLGGKTLLGKAVANGYNKYIFGAVDGMTAEEGEIVAGEVYEIDEKTLAKMDFFMNEGTMVTRKTIDVELENGETLQADTYIWNGSVSK
jgi:gamma-glutamylcyclotransferase (GGCT)/AIG2-like uncharacterized protein YtfP